MGVDSQNKFIFKLTNYVMEYLIVMEKCKGYDRCWHKESTINAPFSLRSHGFPRNFRMLGRSEQG